MPIEITIRMSADTGEELDNMITALHAQLGGSVKSVQHTGNTTASAVVATNTPRAGEQEGKRTRAKKEDTAPAPAPEAPQENVAEAPAPQTEATPSLSVVDDLEPAKAIEAAIKILQMHFGANPNNMSVIQSLQTKYGVKMFQDVKHAQAHQFLADAKLVQSGSFTAA